ncbi:metal-dependent hydrolase [Thermogladius sp. 4427co]|uniref:metal-dependent hydrolase n=1 Tax=Thermogladius sp. 4427co TaxID=3450718 RepID=UPI003F7940A0
MKRFTHVFIGVSIGMFISRMANIDPSLTIILGGVGGLFPDLDLRMGHRVLLHNLTAAFIATVGLAIAVSRTGLQPVDVLIYSSSFLAGWVSHLATDTLTFKGVAWFYPFNKRMYRLKLFKSGEKRGELLGILIGLFFIFLAAFW